MRCQYAPWFGFFFCLLISSQRTSKPVFWSSVVLLVVHGVGSSAEATMVWAGERFSCRIPALLGQLASAPENGHQLILLTAMYLC